MIGNETDAALALARPSEYLYSDEGSSRSVYLIDGIIYKVDRGGYRCNEEEFNTAAILTGNLPEGVFLPEMSLYRINGADILAVEFLDGELTGECWALFLGLACDCPSPCLNDNIVSELSNAGWNDPAYGNAMWVDGSLYLIDVA